MFALIRDGSRRYRRTFLCIFFIFALVVCTVSKKPNLDKPSCVGGGNACSIELSESDFYDIITNDFSGYSVVKCISTKNSVFGRYAGSKATVLCVVVISLFVLLGSLSHYHIDTYRPVRTSHGLIIAYIHNLDGMKP